MISEMTSKSMEHDMGNVRSDHVQLDPVASSSQSLRSLQYLSVESLIGKCGLGKIPHGSQVLNMSLVQLRPKTKVTACLWDCLAIITDGNDASNVVGPVLADGNAGDPEET